jgi:hypothetical protein
VISEGLGVGRVHVGVVIDAVEEHGCLDDVAEGSPFGLEERGEVRDRLADLRVEPVDERAVNKTELTRDIQRVSGSDGGCVWTDWLRHACDRNRYAGPHGRRNHYRCSVAGRVPCGDHDERRNLRGAGRLGVQERC